MKAITITLLMVTLFSCTDNTRARNFGGTEKIELEVNERLINITWKGDDMWLLIEDTSTKKKYFREKSSFGMMEGKINIVEPPKETDTNIEDSTLQKWEIIK